MFTAPQHFSARLGVAGALRQIAVTKRGKTARRAKSISSQAHFKAFSSAAFHQDYSKYRPALSL